VDEIREPVVHAAELRRVEAVAELALAPADQRGTAG
jgi:hypothetical protein